MPASAKRDFEDERTVRDFVKLVQSPEKLRLILVLTTADIYAVGAGQWNAWKATLLSELYHRAEEVLAGGVTADGRGHRIKQAQTALRAQLTDWGEAQFERHVALSSSNYWLSLDTETHARHARLIREAERSERPLTIDTRIDRARAITEVTIYTGDHPGLFSKLAGSLALCGARVLEVKRFTLRNGYALDIFSVQDAHSGGAFDADDKLARLVVTTEQTLCGHVRLSQELAKLQLAISQDTRKLAIPQRVMIDANASSAHTVIEINCQDRPSLLYDVTRTLTDLGLQISSGKIWTDSETAIQVFYVRDVYGLKITHDAKLCRLRERLFQALAYPVGALVSRAREAPNAARLVVRPYPKELEEKARIKDGSEYLLRPIRPKDESAIHRLIERMTPEDIRLRFFAPIRRLSHQAAKRLTQVDYGREMGIVAIALPAKGKLADIQGAARITADPDNQRAEFTVMVQSDLKGRGLGTLLMTKIIAYARTRGIDEIFCEVLRENTNMLNLCRYLGFSWKDRADDPNIVDVQLKLTYVPPFDEEHST